MIKLGIVGHPRMINIISQFIYKYYKSYETTAIPFFSTETNSIIKYIKENEDKYDGLLFTGKIPYDLLNTAMFSQKPWVYIRRNTIQLISTLLQAVLIHQYDIKNISIDSYSEEEVYHIYGSLKLDNPQLDVYVSNQKIFSDNFIDEIRNFHFENYLKNKVSFCITGITTVYESLRMRNIPCMILDPTEDSIKDMLQLLQIKLDKQKQENSQIVVISIERDLPNEYALVKENEYQLALESMKISEEIYLFAQKIQAAVIEQNMGKYLLFTTKSLFEAETDNLQKLSLLNAQNTLRFGTLSVGIGYGETAREAKYNANLGLLKAKKSGGNEAYKVQNNSFLGPISPMLQYTFPPDNSIDGQFQKIASESGVSINSILKLQSIFDQQKTDSFTSKDLASLYGISVRSMNRLIDKLALPGYVSIVGSNVRSAAGRPSRILKFGFHNK